MKIRRACEGDLEKIKDLLSQVLRVHNAGRPDIFKENSRKYTDSEILEIIGNPDTPVFVYDAGEDGVLGYAFCIMRECRGDNILRDMRSLYIDDICVDENARGRHVGSALYEHMKDFARSEGCYNITLNVWECNPTAKKFYERMGLLPQKTVMECVLK